jgi:hypothetical protein
MTAKKKKKKKKKKKGILVALGLLLIRSIQT